MPYNVTPTPNAGSGTQRFMLQAASFRSSADADTLKAKLTLMGVGAGVSGDAQSVAHGRARAWINWPGPGVSAPPQ